MFSAQANESIADIGLNYVLDNYSLSKKNTKSENETLGSFLLFSKTNIANSSLYVSVLATHSSGSPSAYVNDLQVLSNIDVQGQEGVKLYELKYEIKTNSSSFYVGWSDLSIMFNVSEPGQLMLNSSFGTSAALGNTGFYGPSIYPVPAFGLTYDLRFSDRSYFRASLSDPLKIKNFKDKKIQYDVGLDLKDYFSIAEIGLTKTGFFKVALGLWTMSIADENSVGFDQSGVYGQFDCKINDFFRPFLRVETANRVDERIHSNLALGGLFSARDPSLGQLEFGYSLVEIEGRSNPETVYEVVYFNKLVSDLGLSLSYQYIDKPGGDFESAQAFTVRMSYENDRVLKF